MIATGGLQAPTIRHHKGKLYVVGSNMVRKDGVMSREQFIVSTQDIWSGDWSNPVSFDFHGFDTSIFVDDDDRVYVQGAWATGRNTQPHTLIHQLELDLENGKAVSPARFIWGGHSNYDTEGPHIYKKDGWYYLMAAEGGTFEHHMLTISRSRDIWGPYETYENNPILTADGLDSPIQGLGHGELFQDGEGEWWALALGFRSQNGVWPLGREPFLTKVDWPVEGWPRIEQPDLAFDNMRVNECAEMPLTDSVDELIFLRGKKAGNYRLQNIHGEGPIMMRPAHVTLDCLQGCPTFLGKRQRELSAVAHATLALDATSSVQNTQAGLAVYLDPVRYVSIAYDFTASTVTFKLLLPGAEAVETTSFTVDREDTASIDFKIEATETCYNFFFASKCRSGADERAWREAGSISTKALFVRFFTGPVFGIFAQLETPVAEDSVPWVTFCDFRVATSDSATLSKPRI
jgi:beta-xylosidase